MSRRGRNLVKWCNIALHQGIYATIANYLEKELRYMDAGDEAQQRQQGQ
jgi:hypothetical protein